MLKSFPRLMLVVGIGITGAACQEDSAAAPRGYYQPAATGYNQPAPNYYQPNYYQPNYYQPAPNYNYANQQGYQGGYNQARYTTVSVTNRGQNGYRDEVVQQQVACGSQYYDGFRNRTAPRC
ncbi:MAG: hypothetical protein PSV46_05645 [Reyranella sp.]|nr:hypothetical protein [Reyranella sp.]